MRPESTRTALVFGATGQVGHAVAELLRPTWRVIAPTRSEADFTRPDELRRIVQAARPDVVVNAAAYTAVDRAESEPAVADAVNAQAPAVLAEEASRLGALLVHYSSDYVFDGRSSRPYREDDPTGPLNAYGWSKLMGEVGIAAVGCRHVILRTSWVYGTRGVNFLNTMRRLFRERESVRVVDDQHGAPTAGSHIARATIRILEAAPLEDHRGVYHFSAAGVTSWCGFARAILALEPVGEVRCREVVPIASAEYPTAARRPAYSVLDTTRIAGASGIQAVPWEEQLREVMAE